MRKVIQETKWRVSLVTAQGPIEKVEDAPSMDVAINRAMRAFPGQQFTQATASQIDPQSNVPTTQASQQNALPAQMQPLQAVKQLASPAQVLQAKQQLARESYVIDSRAFRYPYSITLPAQFRRILHETSPVGINETNGQYRIILEDQGEMIAFLGKLKTNRDRNAVQVIVNGIRSSSK